MHNSWAGKHLAGILDASKWSNLRSLVCHQNQLIALNVSANTELSGLRCNDNQLTELDVSANTELHLLDCGFNQLTALDVRTNTKLAELYCSDNELTSLDVSKNPSLFFFDCRNNCLPLSELFSISEHRITEPTIVGGPSYKYLGTQNVLPQSVSLGSEIDFSDQSIFKSKNTQFAVLQDNDVPVPENDYTIIDGKITFHRTGNYTVTMTNEAIFSSIYPAIVIVEIKVGNVGNQMVMQESAKVKIYPNPTIDQITITNYALRIKEYCIYNVTGQMVMQGQLQDGTTTLNVSVLANGVYYLKIFNDVVRFIKK